MTVPDKLIQHEINRIKIIKVRTPRVIADAMAKIQLLHDLNIIDYDEYAELYDMLEDLRAGRRKP